MVRIGKFNVLHEKHGECFTALRKVLKLRHAGAHPSGRGKTYVAESDMFEPLGDGQEIPEYRIESVHDGAFECPIHQARRIDSERYGFIAVRNNIIRVPAVQMRTTMC